MTTYRAILCIAIAVFVPCLGFAQSPPVESIDVGARLEPFVDNHLITQMGGTSLLLHPPTEAETVLTFDKPWEGLYCGYVTVIKDGDLYRLYYRGLPNSGKDGSDAEVTCYAESA
ncbi:MAG: hypothetical protein IT364_18820, partial [Candidatus Hydrogenedentes bacterium]|nr:hypothetical protein [Candidatus Hydrogenedentota bacterium]